MAESALFPDEALIAVQLLDGTAVNVTTDIDNFEEGGFERETEFRPFFHGAKVTIKKQQSEGELTLNAKVTRATWDEMLWGNTGSDFTSGGVQSAYRITFLVTKDPAALLTTALATDAVAPGYDTYRKIYANCFLTGFNPKLEAEGMLEGEAVFMVAPKDESSDPNVRIQIGSSGYAAVGDYTTAQKWTA